MDNNEKRYRLSDEDTGNLSDSQVEIYSLREESPVSEQRDKKFWQSKRFKLLVLMFGITFSAFILIVFFSLMIPASIKIQQDKPFQYNQGYMIIKNKTSANAPVKEHANDPYYQPRLSLRTTGMGGVWFDFGGWFRPKYTKKIIIAIHGFPQHGDAFPEPQFLNDLRQHYTIYTWNQRGFYPSDVFVNSSMYDMDYIYGDLKQLVENIREEANAEDQEIVLLGYDWGGFIANIFGNAHPKLVNSVITISSPFPKIPKTMNYANWMVNDTNPVQRYLKNDMKELKDELTASGLKHAGQHLEKTDAIAVTSFIRDAESMMKMDLKFTVPTLAILGTNDTMLPYQEHVNILKTVYSAQIAIKSFVASHWILDEIPEKVEKVVHEFIQNN